MAFNDSIVETNKITIVTLEIKSIDYSKYSGFLTTCDTRGVNENDAPSMDHDRQNEIP